MTTGYDRLVEIIAEATKSTKKAADRPAAIADAVSVALDELLGSVTVHVADPDLAVTDTVQVGEGVEVRYHGTRPTAWHFPASVIVAIEGSW